MMLSLMGSGDALEAKERSNLMGFMRWRMADFHCAPREMVTSVDCNELDNGVKSDHV